MAEQMPAQQPEQGLTSICLLSTVLTVCMKLMNAQSDPSFSMTICLYPKKNYTFLPRIPSTHTNKGPDTAQNSLDDIRGRVLAKLWQIVL